MKVNLETSRLLAYKVGWLKANNKNAFQFSSIAKLHISECAAKNSLLAMDIYGGFDNLKLARIVDRSYRPIRIKSILDPCAWRTKS